MKTRYFDENAKELILGRDIQLATQAAYSTDNPNDPIFARPPSNKVVKIVDGKITYQDVEVTVTDLIKANTEFRERRFKVGFQVTSTFVKEGRLLVGHTEVLNVTDRVKLDIIGTLIAKTVLGYEGEVPLEVGNDTHLVIDSNERVATLFMGGLGFIQKVWAAYRECNKLIAESSNHQETRREIRRVWSNLETAVILP